eukprot:3876466-Pyramimonas_sp.AAC.1
MVPGAGSGGPRGLAPCRCRVPTQAHAQKAAHPQGYACSAGNFVVSGSPSLAAAFWHARAGNYLRACIRG